MLDHHFLGARMSSRYFTFLVRLIVTLAGISLLIDTDTLPAQSPNFTPPEMTPKRTDRQPLEYIDVGGKIPNYPPSEEWGTQEEPLSKMQQPLSATESMTHFVTPVGFTVGLYASEPQLGGKPIAMNWDERGRLWVCETLDYPNELATTGTGRDRIRICEDSDQDGKADKFTIFAEQLSIPTAITFYRGGAIVQNGVETLYLKDVDGDDKARHSQSLAFQLGVGGYPWRRKQLAVRARQLVLGHAGLQRLSPTHRNRWKTATTISNGILPFQAGQSRSSKRDGFGICPLNEQQHLGSGAHRGWNHHRLDSKS